MGSSSSVDTKESKEKPEGGETLPNEAKSPGSTEKSAKLEAPEPLSEDESVPDPDFKPAPPSGPPPERYSIVLNKSPKGSEGKGNTTSFLEPRKSVHNETDITTLMNLGTSRVHAEEMMEMLGGDVEFAKAILMEEMEEAGFEGDIDEYLGTQDYEKYDYEKTEEELNAEVNNKSPRLSQLGARRGSTEKKSDIADSLATYLNQATSMDFDLYDKEHGQDDDESELPKANSIRAPFHVKNTLRSPTVRRLPQHKSIFDNREWDVGKGKLQEHPDSRPSPDEFDYELPFKAPNYGFSITSGNNNKNAIIEECKTPYTRYNCLRLSLIVAINGEHFVGKTLEDVREGMLNAMKELKGPKDAVMIRFRAKRAALVDFKKKGTLRILIVSGNALKHKCSHIKVTVNNITLSTPPIKASYDPVWNSGVTYHDYYPHRSQYSCFVTASKLRAAKGHRMIGQAYFEPPSELHKVKHQIVQLRKPSGNVKGVIVLKTVIINKNFATRGFKPDSIHTLRQTRVSE